MTTRTMLITGASGEIGAATARAAARAGWDLALNGLAAGPRPDDLAAEIVESTGRRVEVVLGDVSIEAEVIAMFDEVAATLGGLDCLVNNAGIAPGYGAFADLTVEAIEATMAVNVTGSILCAREAVRRMATSRGGRGGSIVNLSSRASVYGGAGEWIHYAASKGAIDVLTLGLSKEVAPDGIRVNAVRPGLIATDFGPWAPAERTERNRAGVPMGRAGDPAEIANAIIWLASDEASYVSGALLDVAGAR